METSYFTIGSAASDTFTEKRSRFIGSICPVCDEKGALNFINEKRKQYWDATHNVYAYVLREGQIRRYSDDNEPQGTAGMPVLDVLLKEKLTDCVVVVTRYFGGILLGAGGLVRAYSHGAKLAVNAGGLVEMRLCVVASVVCNYSQYGRVVYLIPEEGGNIRDTIYSDMVEIQFVIPVELLEHLQSELTEFSAGDLSIKMAREAFFSYPIK